MLAREDDAMMKIKLRIMKQLRKNVYGSVTNLRLQDRVLSRNENQQLVAGQSATRTKIAQARMLHSPYEVLLEV